MCMGASTKALPDVEAESLSLNHFPLEAAIFSPQLLTQGFSIGARTRLPHSVQEPS